MAEVATAAAEEPVEMEGIVVVAEATDRLPYTTNLLDMPAEILDAMFADDNLGDWIALSRTCTHFRDHILTSKRLKWTREPPSILELMPIRPRWETDRRIFNWEAQRGEHDFAPMHDQGVTKFKDHLLQRVPTCATLEMQQWQEHDAMYEAQTKYQRDGIVEGLERLGIHVALSVCFLCSLNPSADYITKYVDKRDKDDVIVTHPYFLYMFEHAPPYYAAWLWCMFGYGDIDAMSNALTHIAVLGRVEVLEHIAWIYEVPDSVHQNSLSNLCMPTLEWAINNDRLDVCNAMTHPSSLENLDWKRKVWGTIPLIPEAITHPFAEPYDTWVNDPTNIHIVNPINDTQPTVKIPKCNPLCRRLVNTKPRNAWHIQDPVGGYFVSWHIFLTKAIDRHKQYDDSGKNLGIISWLMSLAGQNKEGDRMRTVFACRAHTNVVKHFITTTTFDDNMLESSGLLDRVSMVRNMIVSNNRPGLSVLIEHDDWKPIVMNMAGMLEPLAQEYKLTCIGDLRAYVGSFSSYKNACAKYHYRKKLETIPEYKLSTKIMNYNISESVQSRVKTHKMIELFELQPWYINGRRDFTLPGPLNMVGVQMVREREEREEAEAKKARKEQRLQDRLQLLTEQQQLLQQELMDEKKKKKKKKQSKKRKRRLLEAEEAEAAEVTTMND